LRAAASAVVGLVLGGLIALSVHRIRPGKAGH
jgi:hypothetical protein